MASVTFEHITKQFDETKAVDPLHFPERHDGEVPETFPSGQ